jgi:hypothetical protein
VAWLDDEYRQAARSGPLSWAEFVERDFGRLALALGEQYRNASPAEE